MGIGIIPCSGGKFCLKSLLPYINCKVIKPKFKLYKNKEYCCKIESASLGSYFLLQNFDRLANDRLIETLIIADTLKRQNIDKIYVVAPYLCYTRQDKSSNQYQSIALRLITDLMHKSGISKIITVDIHSVVQFDIDVVNIECTDLFCLHIKENNSLDNLVVCSPDSGGSSRARKVAAKLKVPYVLLHKKRINDSIIINNVEFLEKPLSMKRSAKLPTSESFLDVVGKQCIIIDDIVDTGKTLSEVAKFLYQNKAKKVITYCTHSLNSNLPESCDLYVTNTIKQKHNIKVIDIGQLIASTIFNLS